MKLDNTVTLFAVFVCLATLSGSLVLADDSGKAKISESTERKFDKIASDRGLLKDFSKTSGENIVKKVEIQGIPFSEIYLRAGNKS